MLGYTAERAVMGNSSNSGELTPKQQVSAEKRARLARSLKANIRRRKAPATPADRKPEIDVKQPDRPLKP
jgi:hypothetical protein